MKNFYMTLLSNSSRQYYPENKINSFTVHLPRYMYLTGDWEVSLTEIQYPYTFTNVEPGQIEIMLETVEITQEFFDWYRRSDAEETPEFPSTWSTHSIVPGFYTDIKDIVAAINETVYAHTQQKEFFSYNDKAHRVGCSNNTVKIGDKWIKACMLSNQLALQLGYNPDEIITTVGKYAPHVINTSAGIPDRMLVFCDILEPQIIGDSWGKVFRVVSTNADINRPYFGQPCSINFNTEQYIPVQSQNFETITIDILDIENRPVSFHYGTLSVKLHFRKKN